MRNFTLVAIRTATDHLSSCVSHCHYHPECISVNFCSDFICELNWVGIYDERAENKSEFNPECVYRGITRQSKPECKEKGAIKNIKDYVKPGNCKIKTKRRDGVWGPWEESTIDTATEWKQFRSRNCTTAAHGGKLCEGPGLSITEWYLWSRTEVDYGQATEYCHNAGGTVFDDLDGSLSQLEFLASSIATVSGLEYPIRIWRTIGQIWMASRWTASCFGCGMNRMGGVDRITPQLWQMSFALAT